MNSIKGGPIGSVNHAPTHHRCKPSYGISIGLEQFKVGDFFPRLFVVSKATNTSNSSLMTYSLKRNRLVTFL